MKWLYLHAMLVGSVAESHLASSSKKKIPLLQRLGRALYICTVNIHTCIHTTMTMYFYACFPCHSTSSKFYCPSSIGFLVCFAWPELCLFIAVVFMGSSMGSKRRSSRSNSTWWTIAGEQLNSTRFFRREKPSIPSFVVPFLHFLRLRATSAASTGRPLKNCWKFSVFFFGTFCCVKFQKVSEVSLGWKIHFLCRICGWRCQGVVVFFASMFFFTWSLRIFKWNKKAPKDAATDFEFVGMATDNESVVLSSV